METLEFWLQNSLQPGWAPPWEGTKLCSFGDMFTEKYNHSDLQT